MSLSYMTKSYNGGGLWLEDELFKTAEAPKTMMEATAFAVSGSCVRTVLKFRLSVWPSEVAKTCSTLLRMVEVCLNNVFISSASFFSCCLLLCSLWSGDPSCMLLDVLCLGADLLSSLGYLSMMVLMAGKEPERSVWDVDWYGIWLLMILLLSTDSLWRSLSGEFVSSWGRILKGVSSSSLADDVDIRLLWPAW